MTSTRFIVGTVGADGNALSAANTGSSNVASTGGSGVLSNAESNPLGSLAAVMTATTTSGAHYFWRASMSSLAINFDLLFKVKTAPSAAVPIVWGGTSTQMWQIDLNTGRTVTFRDDASTARWTSTTALTVGTWYWLRGYVVNDGTVGTFRVQLSTAAAPTTMLDDSTQLGNFDTGGTAYTDLRIGPKCSTGTQTGVIAVGSWSYDPSATGVPAPYSAAVDYTASPADNAGATDSATPVQDLVETPADGAAVTDTDTPQAIDLGLASDDGGGASDSAAAVADVVRSASDGAGATDAPSTLAALVRSVADSAGVTDGVTAVLSWGVSSSDSAGVTDQATVQAGTIRLPADPAAVSDLPTAVLDAVRTAADAAAGSDVVGVVLARAVAGSDPAGGTDQVSVSVTVQLARADQAGGTDSVTISASRTVTDAAGATDHVSAIITIPVGTPTTRIVRPRLTHRSVHGGGGRTIKALKRRQ